MLVGEAGSMSKVAFIDDSGAEGGVVIGANTKVALLVVGRHVEESNTFGDGVRAISGRDESDRTWEVGAKLTVVVEEVKPTSAGGPCTSVNLGMVITRDIILEGGDRALANRVDRSIIRDVGTGDQRWVGHIDGVEVGEDLVGGPPLI